MHREPCKVSSDDFTFINTIVQMIQRQKVNKKTNYTAMLTNILRTKRNKKWSNKYYLTKSKSNQEYFCSLIPFIYLLVTVILTYTLKYFNNVMVAQPVWTGQG